MKTRIVILGLVVCQAWLGAGAQTRNSLSLDTNGVVRWPTNFFQQNSNALNSAVRALTELTLSGTGIAADGTLTAGRKSIVTPSALQLLTPLSQILVTNTSLAMVAGSNGPVTLTNAPTIPVGGDGQRVVIVGTHDTNTVTLRDDSAFGSLLLLGGTNRTLGRGDSIGLQSTSTLGRWNMLFFQSGAGGRLHQP